MNAMLPMLIGCTPLVIHIIRSRAKRRKAERAAAELAAAARRAETEAAAAAAAKQAEKARAAAEREAAAEEKHRAAMRRREERHAQKLQHIAEERAARAQAKDAAGMTPDEFAARYAPAEEPAETKRPETVPAAPRSHGNNAFSGHVVSFTGRLDGMTRAEAIKAVESNGGRAYEGMPAGTTLLVVGDKPGMGKMDKADRWIGQTRKITQKQFAEMLAAPESGVCA